MVMHANTHSSNFDENTSTTAFSLTVIAYQWGWNYFFPRDVVHTLWGTEPTTVEERGQASFLHKSGAPVAYGARPPVGTLSVTNPFTQLYGAGVGERAAWRLGSWAWLGESSMRPALGVWGHDPLVGMEVQFSVFTAGEPDMADSEAGGVEAPMGYEAGVGPTRSLAGGAQGGLRGTAIWAHLAPHYLDPRFRQVVSAEAPGGPDLELATAGPSESLRAPIEAGRGLGALPAPALGGWDPVKGARRISFCWWLPIGGGSLGEPEGWVLAPQVNSLGLMTFVWLDETVGSVGEGAAAWGVPGDAASAARGVLGRDVGVASGTSLLPTWVTRGRVGMMAYGMRGDVRSLINRGSLYAAETLTADRPLIASVRYGMYYQSETWARWQRVCLMKRVGPSFLRRPAFWFHVPGFEVWEVDTTPAILPERITLAAYFGAHYMPRRDLYQAWGTPFVLGPTATVLPTLGEDLDTAFVYSRWAPEVTTTRQSSPWAVSPFAKDAPAQRMRVTSGVVIPSDVAMHVICGSKDVIHSWAIPGLGIKIDCIPGYNCHRRLLVR
jgi:heme/copper-type cytochrome/quinol oxidase subunit 2